MAQIITVEGSIPEDFPEAFREPEVIEEGKKIIARRLALRSQDKVIIKIKE